MQKNVSSVLALERAVWGHMAAIKLPPTERQALVYFVTTFIPSLAEWLHSSPGRRRHETTQNKSDKYGYDGGIYRRPDLAFTNHESKCGLYAVAGRVESGKVKGKTRNRSSRAGLKLLIGRIHRLLRRGNYAERIGGGAPVYPAAVIEYLTTAFLDLVGNAARDNKKTRIIPRHLQLATRNDEELSKFLRGVTIGHGGVPLSIHASLLPTKSEMKAARKV
ncbi:hypothetical protein M513_13022 [Trichuris suis]|uniref:Histone H2A n=1 Tax=Trichuris suis TaxID=68888 RepID=A0A085LM92_9BILA|nr:hypothetical protein M513_13022 [Trichuris suis]